jgi:hypothetical protein
MSPGSGDRPNRAPDAEDRKEPLALLLRIDVRGEAPELRDGGHVEDAHPEEEWHADDDVRARKEREDDEVRDEEEVDRRDELLPAHPMGERAVGLDDADEQERLSSGRILLHLGPAVQ